MASLRKCINDKCKQCIYDPVGGAGNWRQQTEACTSRDCPLYDVRPVSKGQKDDESGEESCDEQN